MSSIQKDLEEWGYTLHDFHLPRWEELPCFDLYIDQVMTLIQGYLQPLFEQDKDSILTSAMINNYAKLKLIPKAEKKRYSRMHLAYLIAITILKQVLTITEVKEGIEYQSQISGLKQAYNLFCDEIESAIETTSQYIQNKETIWDFKDINQKNTAIKMATMSFAGKLVTQKMVHLQNAYHIKEEAL